METQFKVLSENADSYLEIWRAMNVVLESGELRPGHLRAKNQKRICMTHAPNPTLQKPEGFRVKASEGEVVVLYFEPSATQNLKFSGFPVG
jgi:hypothetical protein